MLVALRCGLLDGRQKRPFKEMGRLMGHSSECSGHCRLCSGGCCHAATVWCSCCVLLWAANCAATSFPPSSPPCAPSSRAATWASLHYKRAEEQLAASLACAHPEGLRPRLEQLSPQDIPPQQQAAWQRLLVTLAAQQQPQQAQPQQPQQAPRQVAVTAVVPAVADSSGKGGSSVQLAGAANSVVAAPGLGSGRAAKQLESEWANLACADRR